MYEVDELDRVVGLDGIPQSDAGAPLPIVLADEHKVLVGYLTSARDSSWHGREPMSIGQRTPYRTVAIITFDAYAHFLGPPNDEAFSGHPLHDRGLGYYGSYEVIDSSWIRKLERMNAVHQCHDSARFLKGKRHFIFTFHDSTFECVARDFRVEVVTGTLGYAVDRMCEILSNGWR